MFGWDEYGDHGLWKKKNGEKKYDFSLFGWRGGRREKKIG